MNKAEQTALDAWLAADDVFAASLRTMVDACERMSLMTYGSPAFCRAQLDSDEARRVSMDADRKRLEARLALVRIRAGQADARASR